MIANSRKRILFLEVPKTGSSALSKYLLAFDHGFERNAIIIDGEKISVPTHVSARDIIKIFDSKNKVPELIVGCFRDPTEIIESKYFFYRYGRPLKNWSKSSVAQRARVILAKCIPIWLWALIYPYKSSSQYVCDKSGSLLIDILVDYSRLNAGINGVLSEIYSAGVCLKIPIENKNKKDKLNKFDRAIMSFSARIRLRKDFRLYSELKKSSASYILLSDRASALVDKCRKNR